MRAQMRRTAGAERVAIGGAQRLGGGQSAHKPISIERGHPGPRGLVRDRPEARHHGTRASFLESPAQTRTPSTVNGVFLNEATFSSGPVSPEPASMALILSGMAGLAILKRLRK